MNTYKVRGCYTISFEMEVEANNREEAEERQGQAFHKNRDRFP